MLTFWNWWGQKTGKLRINTYLRTYLHTHTCTHTHTNTAVSWSCGSTRTKRSFCSLQLDERGEQQRSSHPTDTHALQSDAHKTHTHIHTHILPGFRPDWSLCSPPELPRCRSPPCPLLVTETASRQITEWNARLDRSRSPLIKSKTEPEDHWSSGSHGINHGSNLKKNKKENNWKH